MLDLLRYLSAFFVRSAILFVVICVYLFVFVLIVRWYSIFCCDIVFVAVCRYLLVRHDIICSYLVPTVYNFVCLIC